MDAYLPVGRWTLAVVAGSLFAGALAGYVLMRLGRPRIAGWLLLVGGMAAVEGACAEEPAGLRMVALIGFGLLALKAVVAVEARRAGMPALSAGRWLGFLLWIGMRPEVFAAPRKPDPREAARLLVMGVVRIAAGAALIASAVQIAHLWLPAALLLLVGISLVLHFGLLNVMAAVGQAAGFDCRTMFRAPLLSENLTEFWGRRWNIAFNEMTAAAVYKPLATAAGRRVALVAAFLFSGLLHEMAISLPVVRGFGLPLAYFVLHAVAMLVERARAKRGRPIRGAWGRVWVFLWLVIPLPLLFHPPFLAGTLWPLIGVEPASAPAWLLDAPVYLP